MGNQASAERPGGPTHQTGTPSLRARPLPRRVRTGGGSTSEPWTMPETADLPKTPQLRPHLSPTSSPRTPAFTPTAYRSRDEPRSAAFPSSPVGPGRPRVSSGMGNSVSSENWSEQEARRSRGHAGDSVGGSAGGDYDAHSSPMQVPVGGNASHGHHVREPSAPYNPQDRTIAAPPGDSDDHAPKSNLNFPPRLPLPIQEEIHTPGSPIISPEDFSHTLRVDSETVLPHQTSLLSHTTADDDEDITEFDSEANKGRTVPTVIRWRGNAEKVYITGSFAGWARKFRMHRDPIDPQMLVAKLELLPGTHHVKFIVDGEMQLSNELPTAVDYTNILVNYIEVSADDIPLDKAEQQQPPHGLHPPLVHPAGVEEYDFATQAADESSEKEAAPVVGAADDSEKQYISTVSAHYSDEIPLYLPDLDRDENSNRFRRSAGHINNIPAPPSLPMFLGKSILNGTTPMKDDSSVLNMPNHTVLNHLATSSIKNDVLATSLTTRYRRKYVTTIIYRPTKEDD